MHFLHILHENNPPISQKNSSKLIFVA